MFLQYLIIGDGRVARHFSQYFSLLQLPYSRWYREQAVDVLHEKLSQASHVLVLIKDSEIESFVEKHRKSNDVIWIHFSGALKSEQIYGAHPLMTFSQTLYALEDYKKIPFVVDHDAHPFEKLLPRLPNPHVLLDTNKKAKYHALCVLSANFSAMLWQKLFVDFQDEMHFSPQVAHPYLIQQTENLIADFKSAMTGPLVRNDSETIEKNLEALKDDPFQSVYQAFVDCYKNYSDNQ